MPVVKLGKSYQVSLPKKLLEEMSLKVGDYFEVQKSEERRGGKECRSRWLPDH